MNWAAVLYTVFDIAIYSLAGMILLGVGIALVFLLAPFQIRREIRDEQNRALAVLLGAMILGVALIIASVMFSPAGLRSLWSGSREVVPAVTVEEGAKEKAKPAAVEHKTLPNPQPK